MATADLNAGTAELFRPAENGFVDICKKKLSTTGSNYLSQVVLTSLPLIGADLLMLAAATYVSATLTGFCAEGFLISLPAFLVPLIVGFFFVNTVVGLYPGVGLHPIVEFRQTCLASTLLFGVVGIALQFRPYQVEEYYFLFGSWCLCLLMAPIVRSVTRNLVCHQQWWGQPVILFGNGPRIKKICDALQANRASGLRPVGLVDDSYTNTEMDSVKTSYLSREQATSAVQSHCVFWAIVTMSDRSPADIFRVIDEVFLERYPHLVIVPNTTRLPSLWNHAHDCGGLPGIELAERLLMPLPRCVKRGMDLSIAMLGGLLMLPLLGLICLLIKMSSPGPIFYSQRRLGFGAHHFQAWKFRTMAVNADKVLHEHLNANAQLRAEWVRDHKLKNDPRVTWVGKLLRKTSLDELPQIWNVICGQMSLVGPRPIVDAEIEKYGETFERYRKVVPGITGLWQISGRNNTTYQERVDLDSYYVRNWSPWLDLYILIRTVKVVLLREGAY